MAVSTYTTEIAAELCARISEGRSLRSVCTDADMPGRRTVFDWLAANNEFAALYSAAMEARADALFDEIQDIADTARMGEKRVTKPDGKVEVTTGDMVDRDKLRVDARKWMLARMSPRKYGDRVAMEHTGADGAPLPPVAIFQLPDNGRGDRADG